jgi:hypothetical protein
MTGWTGGWGCGNQAAAQSWTVYFESFFPGNLQFNSAAGLTSEGAAQISGQTTPWPAVDPTPITYYIALAPAIIATNNGKILNYFAALGFTQVILIAENFAYVSYNPDGSIATYNNKTYATELALITKAGMNAVIDIEKVDAGTPGYDWANTAYGGSLSSFGPYLTLLQEAGWTTVSSEMGAAGCVEYANSKGLDYVNYTPLEKMCWYAADGITYWDQSIDINTSQNLIEAYYSYDPPYLYAQFLQSAQLGIPSGVLAYADVDVGSIMPNSLAGISPSYQSIIDWSFENGVPCNAFGLWIDPGSWSIQQYSQDPTYFLNFIQANGFDVLVSQLQQTYPPAGTENLAPITAVATNIDLFITSDGGTSYTLSGLLYENLTSNPVPNATIQLQYSTVAGGFPPWTIVSTSTITTDENGAWTSVPISFAADTYYFRAYYAGDVGYIQTYGPLTTHGEGVVVP